MKAMQLFMMSIFAVALASPSYALPSNEVERVYYSDATYRVVVGSEIIMTCYGRPKFPTLEGQRTRYARSYSTPCDEGHDPLDAKEQEISERDE